MVLSQPVGPTGGTDDACQAIVELVTEHPDRFAFAGPKYQLGSSDDLHLTTDGYRRLGAMNARAISQAGMLGGTWYGCMPIISSLVRNGATIDLDFHVPVEPLVFNTTDVTEPTGTVKGFQWSDSTSSATVSTVTITGPHSVRVVLSNTPTGSSKKLWYGHDALPGRAAGAPPITTGRRGNLVDSSTDVDTAGNPIPNWCACFSLDA
jgi:hypothetical protein